MARPISRWNAEQITFLYICMVLGVPLQALAEYFDTTKQNIHQVLRRNEIDAKKLRLTPTKVKQLWDQGALRFLF